MKIENETPLKISWVVAKVTPAELTATFVVKGTFRLVPGGVAVTAEDGDFPTGDTPFPDGPDESLQYASDLVPRKTRTDLLLVGTCHAPRNQPVHVCSVSFEVGHWRKTLNVFGDRVWEKGWLTSRISEPQPFTRMPVRYDKAFGGSGCATNTIGLGYDRKRLPNIESPNQLIGSPNDQPDPAGFGPLHVSWKPRASRRATYSKAYRAERWPWYPDDFDWSYFNAAPRDQQFDGPLRGDETICLANLHPQHPEFRSQLPGIRPQLFVMDCGSNAGSLRTFREVPLALDTLWVDMDAAKLVLVWRGLCPVRTLKLADLAGLHVVQLPLAEPAITPESYLALVDLREAEQRDAEAHEAALEKADDEVDARELAKVEADMREQSETLDRELHDRLLEGHAMLAESGIAVVTPPASTAAGIEEMIAALRSLTAEHPEVKESAAEVIDQLAAVASQSDISDSPWTKARCLEHAHAGKSFVEEDLSQVDLAEIDLSQANLSGARLANTNLSGGKLCRASLVDVDLSGADLQDADLAGADLRDANLTGANLARASLVGANLETAIFGGANLSGANLDRTVGSLTDFSQANLVEAHFVESRLVQPDFSGANLERACFRAAVMPAATFAASRAPGILMESAEMPGLRGGGSPDFTAGDFRGLKAERSFWEGAKLDGAQYQNAHLARADFTGASLREARFDGAHLKWAVFEDAVLERAKLNRTDVFQGSFERANLKHCDLSDANLYEAEFWDAQIEGARFDRSNLQMTKLA